MNTFLLLKYQNVNKYIFKYIYRFIISEGGKSVVFAMRTDISVQRESLQLRRVE